MVKNGFRTGRKANPTKRRQEWICGNGHRTIHPTRELIEPAVYRTVNEASFLLGVHPNTIMNLIKSQKLKATMAGHQFRIQREDLNNYVEGQGSNSAHGYK
jgi:excisionase family DNA binding protein